MIRVGQSNTNGKWVAVAYHNDGHIVMDTVVDEDKAQACLLLASRLLSRLHKLDQILDKNRGSVPFGSTITLVQDIPTQDFS